MDSEPATPKAIETLSRRATRHSPLRRRTRGRGCWENDWEALTALFDFPREHWKHLRTSKVVESPFASLRLRTDAAKRFKNVTNATVPIWKVLPSPRRDGASSTRPSS